MLNSIRLRNLRGFSNQTNSPFIKLAPLTVFVGKNSSGKSTCLRSMPLLRQSMEARTTGPILWFGSYVDFGAFSEALNHDTTENVIFFDFKLDVDISPKMSVSKYLGLGSFWGNILGKTNVKSRVELGVTESENKTVIKSLKVILEGIEYYFDFTSKLDCELKINGKLTKGGEALNYFTAGQLIPEIGKLKKIERTINGEKLTHQSWDDEYLNNLFTNSLKNKLSKYFHSNTSDETIIDGLNKIGICNLENLIDNFKRAFKNSNSFNKNFNGLSESELQELYAMNVHKNLPTVLASISKELESTFKNVRYIAPLRATAERYYRHQDLQVEEIDHTGSNLAMVLKSWSPQENSRFGNWTMENFGFKVRVNGSGLHYALMVQTARDSKEYNINDMGFGFSQILPIVVAIWLEIINSSGRRHVIRRSKQLIFAIEQPELHLHPEYQSKLATVFSKVISIAKSERINLKIIFETHSKTMIDTLGDNIEDGLINNNDISIVLFDKCESENSSLVRFASFDDDGNLDNWPIGFFSGRL